MKKEEKQELLKQRLTNLMNNLEVANELVKSALENFKNLDDFMDIVSNWKYYSSVFEDKNV